MNSVRCETITSNDYPVTIHVRSHELRGDLSKASGGADTAPSAHDFFDISLATCKAHTALWYAKRKNIPLERIEAIVESDDSQERQGVYKMRVHLTLHGALTPEQRAQVLRTAEACPVTKLMTTSDVQIETVAE